MHVQRSHVAVAAAGHSFVQRAARRRWRDPLRILAYHDVHDSHAFEAHVQHLVDHYEVITNDDVIAADDGKALPERAIWITFDDGHRGVVEHALPVLDRYGLTATMFVCPAAIDSDEPLWWEVVERAQAAGINVRELTGVYAASVVTALKSWDDRQRRQAVGAVAAELANLAPPHRKLTSQQLTRWLEAGNFVGNHTWDHPTLDTCDPAEQERQITLAHEWLARLVPGPISSFAYPNGNWSAASERIITYLGYRAGVLFDHRLSAHSQHPLRRSRIRVSSDADPRRFSALVSGVHSALYHAARWTMP